MIVLGAIVNKFYLVYILNFFEKILHVTCVNYLCWVYIFSDSHCCRDSKLFTSLWVPETQGHDP